eukprot:SAG31_NODE_2388_length_5808_cov_2.772640_2_plen_374_part_00
MFAIRARGRARAGDGFGVIFNAPFVGLRSLFQSAYMVSSEPLTKSTALSPVQHLGAEPSTNLFARPVPQDFHFAELRWAGRLLTRSDGAVSWFYRVLQISTMLVTIWMADFVLKYSKISLTWSQLAQKGPLTIINTAPSPVLGYSAVLWAATILATLVPLDAARVALDPLSSGLLQCELQANCAHVDSSKAKTLRNWRIGLGLASVIMAPASFVSCIVTMLGDLSNWGFYPVAGIWLATVVSLSCAVWLSMQVAIVLTSDAIGKVIDLIQSTPVVAGEGWVHLSTQVLALNDKLRTLNKGWGELIAGIGLCSSLAGVAYFCSAVGCADPVEVIKCPQTTGSLLLQGMISLVVPVVASTSFVEISKRCRKTDPF